MTIEALKQRYLHADFNRRLDSYEMAGLAFMDSEGMTIDPVTFFNRFHADKFSPVQAEEIRSIMTVAIHNYDKVQAAPEETVPAETQEVAESVNELEQDTGAEPPNPEPVTLTEPEPEETEPVIVNNFPLISGELPLLTDETIIAGILTNDQFYSKKCSMIAAYFEEHEDAAERVEFLKTAYNTEYSEFDVGGIRVGYKTADNGLMVWEGGSYLSRTKEAGLTWDFLEAYIAKLMEEKRYLTEPEQIKAVVAKIEGKIETIEAEERQMQEGDMIPADPSVRNYTHTIVDGHLYFRDNEVMLRVQETGKTLDRMMGMHKIRQAAMAVIDAQAVQEQRISEDSFLMIMEHSQYTDRNEPYIDAFLDSLDTVYPTTAANCFAAVNYNEMSYARAVSSVQSGAFYATDQASLSVTPEVAAELFEMRIPLRGCEGFNRSGRIQNEHGGGDRASDRG